MASKSFVFSFDTVEVREREFSLMKADQALTVEPKAFRVLLFLLRNPQRLVSKEELLNAVWGDVAVGEGSLTRCIWMLRNALGDDNRSPRYIETVATVGYRFIGKVEVSEDAPGEPEAAGKPNSVGGVETKVGSRKAVWGSVLTGCVVLAVCGAGAIWYLRRPLPTLRVTGYTQITHEGHVGWIAGTDGSRIYFNSKPSSPVGEVIGVSGGEVAKLPLGLGHMWISDVSPDGSTLLVHSTEPSALWTVAALGGPAHFISKVDDTWNHSFSPDGKYIAYSDGKGNLFTMRSDGTDVRKLLTQKGTIIESAIIGEMSWSPDGGRIRFTSDDALWEVSSTGANPHPLFPNWKGPPGQCCGRWTPDGDSYLFLAGGDSLTGINVGGFEQIWSLDERHRFLFHSSREPLPLTSGPIRWQRPIPSRDGKKIFANGTISRGELVRFDPESKKLEPFLGGISAEFVSFSRDGRQIAYVSYPEGVLWRANLDGTGRMQLTTPTTPPSYPSQTSWSPDGTQIMFGVRSVGSHDVIYTVSALGGTPVLIAPVDADQMDPSWSPDGHRIIYNYSGNSLQIFDLDSRQSTKVPGSQDMWQPHWSPDGRYIAAIFGSSLREVKLFDVRTQQWSTLLAHSGMWVWPSFSRDGRFLYVLNGPAPFSIYRVPIPGGKPERVVDLHEVDLTGIAGFWFGLDPSDTPLLLRNNGSSAIYALTLDRK